MRYRALDANGDYSFGQGSANFLVNSPACVAQAVQTRLRLFEGEWFLDQTDGTPWFQDVLGQKNALDNINLIIRARILATQGVSPQGGIENYSAVFDDTTRKLTVTMTLNTIYGQTEEFTVVI